MYNDFLSRKWWNLYVLKAYLILNLYFCIYRGGIYSIKIEKLGKNT